MTLICLHKISGPIHGIIRWRTNSKYSHASININNNIYEIRPFCEFRVLKDFCNNETIDLFEVKLTRKEEQQLESFFIKQIGKKYDYLSILGYFMNTNQDNRKKYLKKWFCSEAIFGGFIHIKKKLLNCEPWEVSPGMLRLPICFKFLKTVKT